MQTKDRTRKNEIVLVTQISTASHSSFLAAGKLTETQITACRQHRLCPGREGIIDVAKVAQSSRLEGPAGDRLPIAGEQGVEQLKLP